MSWNKPVILAVTLLSVFFATACRSAKSTAAETGRAISAPGGQTVEGTPVKSTPALDSQIESSKEFGQPGAAGLGDPYYPQLGNGGYDARHYTLDLTVDLENNVISGTVTMQAVADLDLSAFNLDFVGFEISRVTVNGQPASHIQGSSEHDRELTIHPDRGLQSGQVFTVTVSYHGVPQPFESKGTRFSKGWIRYDGGIFVASEPDAAASWFPVNDHPLDKATYSFRITVPEPYVVAANGLFQGVVDNGETNTFLWEASDPMASYLVTVDIAEYVIHTEEGPGGVPIRHFFPPELAAAAAVDFERTAEMMSFFGDLFGPYPFEAYGVVVVGDVPFALETQTLSLFGAGTVSGMVDIEPVAAHELAHQWFGDSVSVARWSDIWLNEGFATYGEMLWLEHTEGPEQLEERVRWEYDLVSGVIWKGMAPDEVRERVAQDFPPPGTPPDDDLFNQGVYIRGALTLHALRLRVGDDVFFDILREYHERYRYGTATTDDFIAVAEELSDQDLGGFFTGWLYEQNVPDIPELGLTAVDLGF